MNPQKKTVRTQDAPNGWTIPAPLVAPVVILLNHMNIIMIWDVVNANKAVIIHK